MSKYQEISIFPPFDDRNWGSVVRQIIIPLPNLIGLKIMEKLRKYQLLTL